MSRSTAMAWLVAVSVVGCTTVTPSIPPSLDSTPGLSAVESATLPPRPLPPSPTTSPSPVPRPTATVAGTPSTSLSTPLDVEIHEIPTRFTDPLRDMSSLGDKIIWVGSGALWRYSPGIGDPELVIRENHDDPIISIAGSTSGYVYTTRERIGGYDAPNRWRFWYLADGETAPVLLDQYRNERSSSPTFDMSDDHIAWTAFHGLEDEAVSSLTVVDIDRLDRPREVVAYPASDSNIMLPVLHGDELWYGVSTIDWDADIVHPRIEMLDLADPTAAPIVYGEHVRGFMPAVSDRVVAWKGGGSPDLAARNAGQLFLYWRDTGIEEPISIPSGSRHRVAYPSVGDRFVSWHDELDTHFYLYDMESREIRVIAEYEPTGRKRILTPSLSGDLLAFVYTQGGRSPQQLRWTLLPD